MPQALLLHEAASSVMGLHAEPMSKEEIFLLEKEVMPAIGRFIERLRARQARLQPEVA